MTKVGIRELKNNIRYYMSLVDKGQQVVVTNRGRDLALIVPIDESRVHSRLVEMVREGVAAWDRGKPKAHKAVSSQGKSTSAIVIEDRR